RIARPGAVSANPGLYRHRRRDHAARLGHRRDRRRPARRLLRTQANDDLRDSGLFDHHPPDGALVRLGIVWQSGVPRRHCDRIGMGNGVVHDGRTVAGSCPRPRRGAHAVRHRHRQFPRVVRLALCRRNGAGVVALSVSRRRPARPADAVDPHVHSGISNVGTDRCAAPGGARARQRSGAAMAPEERALTRFTAVDLFSDPEIRRRTIIALLLSLTTTLAWWGISSWLPPYAASLAAKANLPPQQWAAYAG